MNPETGMSTLSPYIPWAKQKKSTNVSFLTWTTYAYSYSGSFILLKHLPELSDTVKSNQPLEKHVLMKKDVFNKTPVTLSEEP